MAELVYVLCTATSMACAALLSRGFRLTRRRLLLWSSLCFLGLAVNNILLLVDLVFIPTVDLSVLRAAIGLAAMLVLLFGLVWESS